MYKMDLEQKNGMMEVLIKVIKKKEKKKVMVNMNGVMEVYIKDIGKITNYAEKVFIIILMGKNISENIIII